MARFGEHAGWFAFTSDRFDRSSELPPEANAGNRFRETVLDADAVAALEELFREAGIELTHAPPR